MRRLILFVIPLMFFFSCSRVQTLNLQSHEYGIFPGKIVWLQIAGLGEEHLALLRFSYPESGQRTAFERMSCSGKAWSYNLFELRPDAASGFLAQTTGKSNIKGDCEDFKRRPVWSYFAEAGYFTGIYEGEMADKDRFLHSVDCQDVSGFLKDAVVWEQKKGPAGDVFFFSTDYKRPQIPGRIYYDEACKGDMCRPSILKNVISLFGQFQQEKSKYLFIVRDFSYAKALSERRITNANDILSEIEKIVGFFLDRAREDGTMLVLVTSSAARNVEFPRKGKEWAEFEKNGSHVIFRETSLLSPVFAWGPRAENFCGFFEEAQVFARLINGPESINGFIRR